METVGRGLEGDVLRVHLNRYFAIILSTCSSFPTSKKDSSLLKNWRPVSLLCVDYKLFSKVLSNRLKNFLEFIIQRDQSYCVPDRSIMDNLFLLRDIIDICKLYEIDVGIISLDQEKAFDRVDCFLFSTLRAFGFGENVISLLGLLYNEVFCVVKVGGGLSCPVTVKRGIRQGSPISGQLYAIAIEPLLHKVCFTLTGVILPGVSNHPCLVISAYADDINVFIKNPNDIMDLQHCLELYEKASSAKVNWGKSSALKLGPWRNNDLPILPGNNQWASQSLKFLFFFRDKYLFGKKLGGCNGKSVCQTIQMEIAAASAVL